MSASALNLATTDKSSALPKIVNTMLVILLGIALALLSIKLLPEPKARSLTDIPTSSAGQTSSPSPIELAGVIASLHLFGDASDKPAVVKQEAPRAPIIETKLNLQLAGVFAFEPAENAIAIISAGNAEQNAYGIGDKINNDASLEAVYPDHVVIRNRGKLEKLVLPENVQPIPMRPIQPAQSSQATEQQSTDSTEPVVLATNPGELRDQLARNPAMLGKVVAAEPYQENGKLVGYRITPKQNPEILEAQGILAGDVITQVNNIQLNSQKQGIRALRNAVKAQNLEVTILRDGIEIPISISLAQ
ncbi:MAG: type II secretion system protein GspC [Granulosicoccus sp.]|nr:type II secretion system protein GspC [Granulosicoccus sp.]